MIIQNIYQSINIFSKEEQILFSNLTLISISTLISSFPFKGYLHLYLNESNLNKF